ncbi:MAG: hypothetical protein LBC03_05830, partial [Nitrososphaerota archaeon]|nr:hypothetical protein [Nitrososphaerota archaeon]
EEFNKLFSQMEIYKSTEWIRSPDHAQVGKTQLPAELMTRIKATEPFRFEKTLIISEKSWDDPKTWEWIWEVFLIINDNPGKNIIIRVIQEKKIREKQEEKEHEYDDYFDMGIYKMVDKQFVGFLTSKDNSLTYKWEIGEKCYKDAEKQFDDLNSCAEQHKDIIDKLTKHVIAKRLGLGS